MSIVAISERRYFVGDDAWERCCCRAAGAGVRRRRSLPVADGPWLDNEGHHAKLKVLQPVASRSVARLVEEAGRQTTYRHAWPPPFTVDMTKSTDQVLWRSDFGKWSDISSTRQENIFGPVGNAGAGYII